MGVQGLTPFLQKFCPEVIKIHPERFRGFNGKTIAIDGTLITQRLHFSQTPHQYKHVLGWYRLISELNENNVRAICVFDGKQRSAAKTLEIERRKNIRRLGCARGSIENERLARLQKLKTLLKPYQELPLQPPLSTVTFLKEPKSQPVPKSPPALEDWDPTPVIDYLHVEDLHVEDLHIAVVPAQDVQEDDFRPIPYEDPASHAPGDLIEFDDLTWIGPYDVRDQDFAPSLHEEKSLQAQTPEEISTELAALYQGYQSSVKPALVLPSSDPTVVPSKEDVSESKLQTLLTQEEGQLWSQIVSPIAEPEDADASQTLTDLIDRSQVLSSSYERRNRPPSRETYEQSKLILDALGVPCVDCDGPYEAEALASSLVHHGFADYVASEDTDVLVFDAPLLRNVSSRRGELMCISGAGVRTALELSRESFVDFALLLGTDFTTRVPKLGPTRALRFLRAHARIESVLVHEPQYLPPDAQATQTYLAQVERARHVFNTLPPVPDWDVLSPRPGDEEKVAELLRHFKLSRAVADADWDPQASLTGNYYGDDPFGEGSVIGFPGYGECIDLS
ncbi:PIN domain-like protein [Phellopilus nigrolimitatus]|nr:PIN domain-like protein [Phellopilus nigrolimitatus]